MAGRVAAWNLWYCLDLRRIPKFQSSHGFSNRDLLAIHGHRGEGHAESSHCRHLLICQRLKALCLSGVQFSGLTVENSRSPRQA